MFYLRVADCTFPAQIAGATSYIVAGQIYLAQDNNSHVAIRDTKMAAHVGIKLDKAFLDHLKALFGTAYTLPKADGSGTFTLADVDLPVALSQVYNPVVSDTAIQGLFTQIDEFPMWSDRYTI